MAQNITIAGASYTGVPRIDVPKTGGGTAQYLDTSGASATAADIAAGKTAGVNGSMVTGSMVIQRYYTGSSAPANSLGANGDIYFMG